MIVQFRDEFAWLSNFTPAKIKLYGFNYPSVEHAFMSAKSDDLEWKKFCINAMDCGARFTGARVCTFGS